MRVTIIDDEWHNLDLLEKLLGKVDSTIEIIGKFQNPLEAIPHILARQPEVIILDIELPYVNGVDMIRMMAHTHGHFIIVSANNAEKWVEEYQLERTQILIKPFTVNDLKAVIEKVRELIISK